MAPVLAVRAGCSATSRESQHAVPLADIPRMECDAAFCFCFWAENVHLTKFC